MSSAPRHPQLGSNRTPSSLLLARPLHQCQPLHHSPPSPSGPVSSHFFLLFVSVSMGSLDSQGIPHPCVLSSFDSLFQFLKSRFSPLSPAPRVLCAFGVSHQRIPNFLTLSVNIFFLLFWKPGCPLTILLLLQPT